MLRHYWFTLLHLGCCTDKASFQLGLAQYVRAERGLCLHQSCVVSLKNISVKV